MKHVTAVVLVFYLFFYGSIGARFCSAISGDDIIPISSEKEKRIGASLAEQVDKRFAQTDDPLIQKRFEDIGKRLASICDRQELIYHFKVLKAKEDTEEYYNAFALPGGYVYIFDAFMEIMGTDDKIAAIVAHELGHICARHAVQRLQSSLGANALMVLALVTSRDGRSVAQANEALTQLMMAYSRKDEFEADRLSTQYLKKAEFDSQSVVESLLTLKKLRKKSPDRNYIYYRSHPYLSERIAAARAEIKGYTDFDSYINLPKQKEDFF
ncbi:MAG: hypothetical protein A3K83_06875 [Omnitrophica WOR_2 bacterium RBG_13_44_8b]|nr:MAG: hypothetical protein A3K83_06875 [Omnitrophica WOR_2 bacterium RBG_13_44_8b]